MYYILSYILFPHRDRGIYYWKGNSLDSYHFKEDTSFKYTFLSDVTETRDKSSKNNLTSTNKLSWKSFT